jgi:PAS domain S-box-containing protein
MMDVKTGSEVDGRTAKRIALLLVSGLILFGLYLTSRYNYLLFHTLVELFGIVVAFVIFVIFWNSRRFLDNGYFLFVGIAYLFVGITDLLHTLAYKGMGVFPDYDANLPTQLWIAARYIESLSLLSATFFLRRKMKLGAVLIGYLFATGLLYMAVFYWHIFPDCFVEGVGLTPFKRVSEYVIVLILVGSIGLLSRERREFDQGVFRLLIASVVVTILSELAFTLYVDVYGLFNMIGHLLKIVSVFFIYRAFIDIGLTKPYDLVFRELKRREDALKECEKKYRSVIETSYDGIVVVDEQGRVVEWNRSMEQITGLDRAEVLDQLFWDIQFRFESEPHRTPEWYEQLKANTLALLKTGQAPWLHQVTEREMRRADGVPRVFQQVVSPIQTQKGFMIAAIVRDVTERRRAEDRIRASLREKEVMLAEIHHRVKNNLQVISSLLDFQADYVRDGRTVSALRDSQHRIQSMSLVHEQLYQAPDLARIDFADYVQTLTADLLVAYRVDSAPVALKLDIEDVFLEVGTAIPCGLLINELVSNALKHAFPDRDRGSEREIRVTLQREGAEVALVVSDNGVGLPSGFECPSEDTLGMFLIETFVEQLGGKIEWRNDGGTTCRVLFAP